MTYWQPSSSRHKTSTALRLIARMSGSWTGFKKVTLVMGLGNYFFKMAFNTAMTTSVFSSVPKIFLKAISLPRSKNLLRDDMIGWVCCFLMAKVSNFLNLKTHTIVYFEPHDSITSRPWVKSQTPAWLAGSISWFFPYPSIYSTLHYPWSTFNF